MILSARHCRLVASGSIALEKIGFCIVSQLIQVSHRRLTWSYPNFGFRKTGKNTHCPRTRRYRHLSSSPFELDCHLLRRRTAETLERIKASMLNCNQLPHSPFSKNVTCSGGTYPYSFVKLLIFIFRSEWRKEKESEQKRRNSLLEVSKPSRDERRRGSKNKSSPKRYKWF